MSKYKCIIFDCDGVLVDSEPISNGVLVDMANSYGANIDLKYALKHFKGGTIKRVKASIEGLIEEELPVSFEADYRALSYQAFKEKVTPVSGIKEVLESLEIPYCVASSGPVPKIKLNLELTGLFSFFGQNIFSCYTIEKWKPDPAIFTLAAKTMGFSNSECLVIEDSITGVQAAINGGFDVFGYTAHDYNNELSEKCTNTFSDMRDLIRLL
ncbi:MAG: HAD family hydrolase [Bacteroidetes bacterium MedPE-SWsnd-G2]|nr:MAG: HAD family hydrolase [Bacteroidetes bacterium MedPE-SWsnd-G2]